MALNNSANFADLLRRYRVAAGLTQEALAEQAGLSARGISDLERGARRFPYPDTVDRLAAALKLDGDERSALLAMRRRSLPGDGTHADTIPLVGRRTEWRQLQAAWQDASTGGPRCVVLEGEAGIGKSHLARELLTWADRKGFLNAYARAYAAEGRLSYAPVADWLRRAALQDSLAQLDTRTLADVAQLTPELLTHRPDLAGLQGHLDQQSREPFFRSLARAVLSANTPLLLVLDDLQWCDQDTLEWLHFLIRFDPRAPLLLVGTARLDGIGPRHPLTTLLADSRAGGQLIELALGPLDAADTAELAVRVAGRVLHDDELRRLFDETEGQPLYVVETIRASMAGDEHAVLPTVQPDAHRLPARVHAVIAARLAQLSDSAREMVRLAATIGRSFTLDLLVDASATEIDVVVAAIDELWQRQIVREHELATYDFSHDKIREVAYADMTSARRSLMHRRVAQALEGGAGTNLDAISAQVAAHYEHAGLVAQAVPYYQRAAEVAQRVLAHHDAIQLIRRGLELLARQAPGRDRDVRELAMQTALGSSLVATLGYAASDPPYRRAQELCQRLGQSCTPPVIRALAIAAITQAQFDQSVDLGGQLLSLALEVDDDPMLVVEGHYVLGVALFWKGALIASREHLEQALDHKPSAHVDGHLSLFAQDPRVVCSARLALDLWLLGFPKQAHSRMADALQLAHALAHPFSVVYALSWSVWIAMLDEDVQGVLDRVDQCLALCREHGIQVVTGGLTVGRGWALAQGGVRHAGIDLMRQGIAEHQAGGNVFFLPSYLGLVAEQCAKAGETELGLAAVSDALTALEATDERWFEAELHRVRGVLLSQRGDLEAAESEFQRALSVARQQGASGLESRAVASLADLLNSRT